jgi:hypothetical protein
MAIKIINPSSLNFLFFKNCIKSNVTPMISSEEDSSAAEKIKTNQMT